MRAKLRSWWQRTRKSLVVIVFVVALVVIALIFLEVIFYGTGFAGKTLWDWLQLLIIPAVLALGGYLFTFTINRNERKAADRHNQTEREIAQDNQREAALQAYINSMSELLLHEKLRESDEEDEVRKIARVRTLTVLPRLDEVRRSSVLQFLYESLLIINDSKIIDLHGANLMGVNLSVFGNLLQADFSGANLSGVNLSGVILMDANLHEANLSRANLSGAKLWSTKLDLTKLLEANLSKADLSGADLSGANLSNAILYQANVSEEQLKETKSLEGATMPDGSIHP